MTFKANILSVKAWRAHGRWMAEVKDKAGAMGIGAGPTFEAAVKNALANLED